MSQIYLSFLPSELWRQENSLIVRMNSLELANIFDEAVLKDREVMIKGRPETLPGMIKLIHRHRDQLMHRGDRQSSESSTATDINLVLLSGGLGSSAYIKYKIEEFLANGPETGSGASVPKVHTLTRPQMCVCRGLLENRVLGIWRAARCNGSYGILQRKPYKLWKPRHFLAKHGNHLHNSEGRRYVEQVSWLVKKVRNLYSLLPRFTDMKQNQPRPSEPPTLLHTFEIGAQNLLVEFVVSNEAKPSRFPSRGMRALSVPFALT